MSAAARSIAGILALVAAIGSGASTAAQSARPEPLKSGIEFASAEVKTMQADDFTNPGMLWVTRGDINASDEAIITTPLPPSATRLEVSGDHMANFFDCVRSRKHPIASAEVGHRSATICHLGVIALRLGTRLQWDPARERFTGEGARQANRWVSRPMRKPYDYTFI